MIYPRRGPSLVAPGRPVVGEASAEEEESVEGLWGSSRASPCARANADARAAFNSTRARPSASQHTLRVFPPRDVSPTLLCRCRSCSARPLPLQITANETEEAMAAVALLSTYLEDMVEKQEALPGYETPVLTADGVATRAKAVTVSRRGRRGHSVRAG
jgi:hypothetical protein